MRFLIRRRAGDNRHVHALRAFDFVQFDFRENGLVGDAEGIIAAAIEFARREPAEVADTRQRGGDQAVKKFVHRVLAQRHAAADGLVFAQFELGDAVARLADGRFAAGDEGQILGGVLDRAFFQRGAHAHVHDNLFEARDLVDVFIVPLLLQSRHYVILVFIVQSCFHFIHVTDFAVSLSVAFWKKRNAKSIKWGLECKGYFKVF